MIEPYTIQLPPIEALWPWPRAVNVHLADIKQECLDWSTSVGASTETDGQMYEKGNFTLLAGLMFARTSKEILRSFCDMLHVLFMFDEHSDEGTPEEVWRQAEILTDALRSPDKPRPQGEWVGGEFARQFFHRLPKACTDRFRRRFLHRWIEHVGSLAKQAEHRSDSRILDVESYFALRRLTIGTHLSHLLLEHDMDIPDNVREHPILIQLETTATDLIIISNDVLSYNKEQAVGDDEHNLITVIMKQFNMDVQQALDRAGELIRQRMESFNALYQQVPRWAGPIDLDVQRLVDGMAQCVSGGFHWSYESRRYFGTRGLEVKETRIVGLLPKVNGSMANPSTVSPMPVPQRQGVAV